MAKNKKKHNEPTRFRDTKAGVVIRIVVDTVFIVLVIVLGLNYYNQTASAQTTPALEAATFVQER